MRVAEVQTAAKVQSRPRRTNEKRARPRGQTGEENGKKKNKKVKNKKTNNRGGEREKETEDEGRRRERRREKRGESQLSRTLKEFWQIYERETLRLSIPDVRVSSQPCPLVD